MGFPRINYEDTPKFFNSLSEGKLRNELCICGSGKKVKKCHGKDRLVTFEQKNEISELMKIYSSKIQNFKAQYRQKVIEEGNENERT